MPAPILNSHYLTVDPLTAPTHPPNQNEVLTPAAQDPAFAAAIHKYRNELPGGWSGDNATLEVIYAIAKQYKTPEVAPSLTTLTPSTTPHNVAFSLVIAGTGFDADPTVTVGVAIIVPTSISPTSLTVPVGAAAILNPGSLNVSVTNQDGKTSNTLPLTLT
jgi:hypothetical protein